MPRGSQTIRVVPAYTDQQVDWQGDPLVEVERTERDVTGCVLVPRINPDDETIIIDEYQVIMLDTSKDPPAAEDSIKVIGNRFIDPESEFEIDGGIAPYAKPSGQYRGIVFNIRKVR